MRSGELTEITGESRVTSPSLNAETNSILHYKTGVIIEIKTLTVHRHFDKY